MNADPPPRSDELAMFLDCGQAAQRAVNFELAAAELRKLGITLTRLPGEYRVNLTGGPDVGALTAETLDQALALGRDMAVTLQATPPPTRQKGRRRRRRMTPKAYNKRLRLAHMRKLRARTRRQSAVPAKPTTDDT